MTWLSLIVTGAAVLVGYVQSRYFVRTRLRYVDAVQKGGAPLGAGVLAAVVAIPLVAILPIVGVGTALFFGASVGLGVAAGAKDIRRGNAGLIEP
jgi:hypothetical protein